MIGVIGLGLIGGSLAKALNENTGHTVCGYDIDKTVSARAKLLGAIEDELTDDMLPECDIVIVALYPADTVRYVRDHAGSFKKGSVILDCSGIKRMVCSQLQPVAEKNGFVFMGGHPMAGLEHSGFGHAKKALFSNASMVLIPSNGTPIATVEKIKKLCISIGFTNIQISSPEEHDRMIAFTSQLAHIISSAYIKSGTARDHQGFSAGSYKDLSRVAKLNEKMWTELFIENADFLSEEIDGMIARLQAYSSVIKNEDEKTLYALLKEGRETKEKIDKEYF